MLSTSVFLCCVQRHSNMWDRKVRSWTATFTLSQRNDVSISLVSLFCLFVCLFFVFECYFSTACHFQSFSPLSCWSDLDRSAEESLKNITCSTMWWHIQIKWKWLSRVFYRNAVHKIHFSVILQHSVKQLNASCGPFVFLQTFKHHWFLWPFNKFDAKVRFILWLFCLFSCFWCDNFKN